LSNQRIGWCCIDRLNWQRLPDISNNVGPVKNKLFTFLDHDGVPWNNNNAEHAIKALVRLRNRIGGQSSARGMRDYLVLLSISQTCRCKGASFLDFLQSGQIDINAFTDRFCKSG
jgi:hypothetical protein